MEKGLTALLFSFKGNFPLDRIHIPTLGVNQSAHWAVNYFSCIGQSDHNHNYRPRINSNFHNKMWRVK